MSSRPTASEELAGLPPSVQESHVVNDLLYAFLGLDGRYVRARLVGPSAGALAAGGPGRHGGRLAFVLDAQMDAASHELVGRVLPIW